MRIGDPRTGQGGGLLYSLELRSEMAEVVWDFKGEEGHSHGGGKASVW